MQKGNMTEFDLFVKRSLQDAEEEVSPSVWDGIERRLDAMEAPKAAAASRKNHSFSWGWPAAALAMAAVLAAVIILPGTKSNSNLIHNTAPVAEAQSGAQTTVSGQAPDAEIPAAVAGLLAQNTPSRSDEGISQAGKGRAASAQGGQGSINEAPAAEPQTAENKEVEQQVASPAAEPLPAKAGPREAEVLSDEFARMAFEDQMSRKGPVRISALAGGILGTGNSASSAPMYGVNSKNDYIPGEIHEEGESSYSIPFSVGAGVRFALTPRLSVGTGVDYSLVSRTFNGSFTSPVSGSTSKGSIRHNMQYIGVPVNVYYNLLGRGSLRLYAFGTGEAEWALSSKYSMAGETVSYQVRGTQLSAGGGLGVEFRIVDGFSLYVAPNARYYFNCGQPKSIRTERPLLINFNAGLMFNF